MKFHMVVNYYLVSLSFKCYEDPCTNACAWVINARNRDKTCTRTLTTPIWNWSLQDNFWPPYKISWRSELSLRRYLQNNTGVCLILNFQSILNISKVEHKSLWSVVVVSKPIFVFSLKSRPSWTISLNIGLYVWMWKAKWNYSWVDLD